MKILNFLREKKFIFVASVVLLTFLSSCGIYSPSDARKVSPNSKERVKKNLEEGKGMSLKKMAGGGGGTNYQFASSNPMWRASLEILDFLPLSVVDYSGGTIVTDWYSDELNSNSSIKITVRFLSNEIQTNSLKIIVHEKKCTKNSSCSTKILNSKIRDELLTSIIRKAAIYKAELKKK